MYSAMALRKAFLLSAALCALGVGAGATSLVVYPTNLDHVGDGRVTGSLNGQAVTFEFQRTYHPSSAGDKDFNANYVRFAADGPVDVALTVNATITTANLRTVGKDLSFTRNGPNFQFTLPGPGSYYLQLPDLNTSGRSTYTVFFFFDDLTTYNSYQTAFAAAKNVLNYGVVSSPTLDQTSAIQSVLNGGGSIYFPAGIYRTGQLSIPSNTTVYMGAGAVLKGTDSYNASRYIYINGRSNVRIAGLGTIDANGFTSGNMPTNGHLIDMESSTGVRLDDVLFRNSNSWQLHIRKCDQVTFDNIKVFSGKDGIDPDGSRDVLIKRAVIQSVDDGFAVKSKFSGYSCERVTMRDCVIFSCASSMKIGTENYYGAVRDITWDNCDAVDADRGCILYTKASTGVAPISNITWQNIRIFNFPWAVETGGAPFQFTNDGGASISGLLVHNAVAYPRTSCAVYGGTTVTLRNIIMNGSSSIGTTGVTFDGVIWPGVTSLSKPVVFIDPSTRNQNEYRAGDQVTVSVQHPYGKAITRVELFVDGASAGVDTSSPFAFTLGSLAVGDYNLQATATDADGATNTTAPKRIKIVQSPGPWISAGSISSNMLIADDSTQYAISLTVGHDGGVSRIRDMRMMLHNGGAFATENGRGYVAWGQNDADISYYGGSWTYMGDAAGGGRWGWCASGWGSDTYITPVSASTTTSGNARTVTWTFRVKPAWAIAIGQKLRAFARDDANANTGWTETSASYDVYLTAPPPTLRNPGFEDGPSQTAWTKYGVFDSSGSYIFTGPWLGGIMPHSGTYFAGSAASYESKNGGLYQRLTGAVAGQCLRFSAWVLTYNLGSSDYRKTNGRIGIDPYGGTDPASANVVWSERYSTQYAWVKASVGAVAAGSAVTVFLEAQQQSPVQWNINAFDDCELAALQSGSIPQALAKPDGTGFAIIGRTATAGTSEIGGALYVEEADRSGGIRVSAGGAVSRGDKVNVFGQLETNSDGERQLAADFVQVVQSGQPLPSPVVVAGKALGGAAAGAHTPGVWQGLGPYNVGLLVKCAGRVTDSGSGWFYLDDGSGLSDGSGSVGVRVDATGLSNPTRSYCLVTGISTMRLVGGHSVRCIRPRTQADIVEF